MLGNLPGTYVSAQSTAVLRATRGGRTRWLYFGVKRTLDVFVIMASAPLVVPLVLLLAFIVRRDGGKAFYGQPRLGKDGRVFMLWKLRSMVADAEGRLEQHLSQNPDARREWESTQKLRHDPRITTVGHYLRKYSLDELPQLWNVFRGQMSLVGPRPMFPEQRPLYPGTAYFDLRPGLTGLWQVSERNRCSFADRAVYDTTYARSMSMRVDLAIMARTFAVVMRGTGC